MVIKTWLICFDVSDDKQRRQVVKTLLGHGLRVQRSVFEVTTSSDEQLQRLRTQLLEFLEPTDDLRLYRLCADCRKRSINLNGGKIADFPLAVIL